MFVRNVSVCVNTRVRTKYCQQHKSKLRVSQATLFSFGRHGSWAEIGRKN